MPDVVNESCAEERALKRSLYAAPALPLAACGRQRGAQDASIFGKRLRAASTYDQSSACLVIESRST